MGVIDRVARFRMRVEGGVFRWGLRLVSSRRCSREGVGEEKKLKEAKDEEGKTMDGLDDIFDFGRLISEGNPRDLLYGLMHLAT